MKQKKTIKQIANELGVKLQFKEKPFIEENTKKMGALRSNERLV